LDIITTHINADFDGFAGAVAAGKLYPDAVLVFPGSVGKKVRDFIDAFHPIEIRKFKDILKDKVKTLVIVDTRRPDRIEQLAELLHVKGVKVHIYDHHLPVKGDLQGDLEVVEQVGAVSTIFTELFQKKKMPITPLEATVLCLGIYEETGCLTFSSTTPRDLMAASYLLMRGANLNIVSGFLRHELSREEFALMNELVQSLREVVIHGVSIKIGKGNIEGFGDVSHIAHRVMDMAETDALVLLIRMDDKILIIARSKTPELNVADVVSVFGGGGHAAAASATIKDAPFEIVEERVIVSLNANVRPLKTARDVMTTPVIVVQWNNRIKQAGDMMTRYGVNVLPVVKKQKYMGILTREVVEKALFHGFGSSPCLDFATTDAVTLSLDTPLAGVETAMLGHNQRFVPVVEGDKITGAITRTDILRALYEDFLRKSRVSPRDSAGGGQSAGFGRNISSMLRDRLPAPLYKVLSVAGAVADELGAAAYLVGGCVRDLLRGEENLDMDIVVEADGIAFANAMAQRLEAKVTAHRRFGTAQLIMPNTKAAGRLVKQTLRIDIATARTEYYESPAALPKVETSSIKKDLYRRDFTINTLAVQLNRHYFGLLLDFFGAQRDLKDKVIRVLHNLSFVEDPTRAFRAIRFSERFGFRLTRHTETLIKHAVRMSIFEKLSGSRIYDELMLTFHETNPIKAIVRLGQYGLLRAIHPKLAFSPGMEALFQSVHDTISWFELLFLNEKYNKGMLYIMALPANLEKEERSLALQRLAVPPRLGEKIVKDLESSALLLNKLSTDDPVEIYHLLHGLSVELDLFCMAATQDIQKKKAVSQYLLDLRHTAPLVTGRDLKKMGVPEGPVYTRILGQLMDERLRKRLNTKDEEIAFVKKLINSRLL
jgi:tRNA nucleotidyltransferase (CCA-adding enzyme)